MRGLLGTKQAVIKLMLGLDITLTNEKLNPKQAAFVKEYLVDRNGKQALIRAGYAAGQSAEVSASRMIRIPKIKLAIEIGEQKHQERCNVTKETITKMMNEDRDLAIELSQSGPAVTTTMNLAKLHGLITDKAQVEANVGVNFNTYMQPKPKIDNGN